MSKETLQYTDENKKAVKDREWQAFFTSVPIEERTAKNLRLKAKEIGQEHNRSFMARIGFFETREIEDRLRTENVKWQDVVDKSIQAWGGKGFAKNMVMRQVAEAMDQVQAAGMENSILSLVNDRFNDFSDTRGSVDLVFKDVLNGYLAKSNLNFDPTIKRSVEELAWLFKAENPIETLRKPIKAQISQENRGLKFTLESAMAGLAAITIGLLTARDAVALESKTTSEAFNVPGKQAVAPVAVKETNQYEIKYKEALISEPVEVKIVEKKFDLSQPIKLKLGANKEFSIGNRDMIKITSAESAVQAIAIMEDANKKPEGRVEFTTTDGDPLISVHSGQTKDGFRWPGQVLRELTSVDVGTETEFQGEKIKLGMVLEVAKEIWDEAQIINDEIGEKYGLEKGSVLIDMNYLIARAGVKVPVGARIAFWMETCGGEWDPNTHDYTKRIFRVWFR